MTSVRELVNEKNFNGKQDSINDMILEMRKPYLNSSILKDNCIY